MILQSHWSLPHFGNRPKKKRMWPDHFSLTCGLGMILMFLLTLLEFECGQSDYTLQKQSGCFNHRVVILVAVKLKDSGYERFTLYRLIA